MKFVLIAFKNNWKISNMKQSVEEFKYSSKKAIVQQNEIF
jgi:hypothetical protein